MSRRPVVMRPRRGAALVAALFTIAVLASITAVASSQARRGAAVVDNRRSQATARAMAESGVLAGRATIEAQLVNAGTDSARLAGVFDALTEGSVPVLQDSVGDGDFAVTVVDVSARLDVNRAGAEGLQRLLATVAPAAEAAQLAAAIDARVRGVGPDGMGPDDRTGGTTPAMDARRARDSVAAQLLGRDQAGRAMQPFATLDELLTIPGMRAEWLEAVAADLTVDGDGRINRRHASARVLAAATGTLVDRPSRLLLVARGWRRGHALTREIQAVYDVNGTELTLVRWREQDR